MSKPKPIIESQICSECGLPWLVHPENPRRRDCIELLKAEIAAKTWPWSSVTQYCNWGHPNCYINHWYSGTYDGTDSVETDTYLVNLS